MVKDHNNFIATSGNNNTDVSSIACLNIIYKGTPDAICVLTLLDNLTLYKCDGVLPNVIW